MLRETGIVVAKQYAPEINASGAGIGMSSGGDMVLTHTSVHDDEKYMVVFKCQHGVVFSVNNKKVFAKLNDRDSVDINYYEIVNSEGRVKDFDFVDANKRNP